MIIIALTVITSVIPNFIDFLNIVGTLGVANLGFIFPPLLYTTHIGWRKMDALILGFNIFLLVLGSIGGALSIYVAIYNMVTDPHDH